jgi:hypothetical protein
MKIYWHEVTFSSTYEGKFAKVYDAKNNALTGFVKISLNNQEISAK